MVVTGLFDCYGRAFAFSVYISCGTNPLSRDLTYRRLGPRVDEGRSYVHAKERWAQRLQIVFSPPSLHLTFLLRHPSQATNISGLPPGVQHEPQRVPLEAKTRFGATGGSVIAIGSVNDLVASCKPPCTRDAPVSCCARCRCRAA